MKAWISAKYGLPSSLQFVEMDRPEPGPGEVRVKIHASAINDYDWGLVRGIPRIYRLLFGLRRPRWKIPGSDASVFEPGARVYGDISEHGFGSFAEYICINEKSLRLIPDGMNFVDAAALPHASMLAVQGLLDAGQLQNGERVLINGAGGGVGAIAVQIAAHKGAEITGVDSGEKLTQMEKLPFDRIIDYRQIDFTREDARYDLILDCKTSRWPLSYLRALKPDGRYVTVGGELPKLIMILLFKLFVKLLSSKSLHIVALKANKDLALMEQLYLAGNVHCVIDGPHNLGEADKLLQYFGEGRHSGKIVLKHI
jgi:NADPH:quinone reductase-like Zn-dependent oxidoreductase